MALTKLNALGSAIRQKVGEAEKKTLPQLKDIVDNQLVCPQNELSVTTNGNYDVKSYASVNVATDERTDTDRQNAIDIASWNTLYSSGTDEFNISIRGFEGEIPYIDGRGYSTFSNAFANARFSKLTVEVSENCTSLIGAFQAMSNLTELTILGPTKNVTNFNYLCDSDRNLEKINGELDFTSATNIGSIFNNCSKLTEIHIKANSISKNNLFSFNSESPKTIILEMINGLAEVTDYHTTAFGSALKTKMGATATKAVWWCKLVDGIYVDCDETDDGAVSYASVITSKGWTIV